MWVIPHNWFTAQIIVGPTGFTPIVTNNICYGTWLSIYLSELYWRASLYQLQC